MPDVIDLSRIAPPDALPEDYEAVLQEMIADYQGRLPEDAEPPLESDPAVKVLEAGAYRENLRTIRINRAVKSVLLATATGSMLEHIAAFFGIYRLVVTPGDPTATPPTGPVYEDDDSLRERAQLAPEGYTTAGSRRSYESHARNASGDVLHARFASPQPAEAIVAIISRSTNGLPSAELLATVRVALSDEDVRPAGDRLTVQAADIVDYQVAATLEVEPGPDPAVVLAAARQSVETFAAENFRIGRSVPLSGLYAALTVPNVLSVFLAEPAETVLCADLQAARTISITVTLQ